MHRFLWTLAVLVLGVPASAQTLDIAPQSITEWKMVFGQVETRDRVPARARIGGTVVALDVTEGDRVDAGQPVARIDDVKLGFQIDALDARIEATQSRLQTAQSELARGEALMARGIITGQRLEELQTSVSVLEGEMSGLRAERLIVERQIDEGQVLAPEAGIVLTVPISLGSFVAPGEPIAIVGGGGIFLRLALPERHAEDLSQGDRIEIGTGDRVREGRLAKIYPQIEGGRVQADVEVEGLDPGFIGRRVPVRLPVGQRQAILVPETALTRHGGIDFVTVSTPGGPVERAVVPGAEVSRDGTTWREILTGLGAGDTIVTTHD